MVLQRIRYALRGIRLRVRFLFRKDAAEREMDEELRFHLEQEFRQNLRSGMGHAEARRQAQLAFGGVERFKEQVRDSRGVRPLEELGHDLRYGLRQLRRAPLFTAVAVVTLAIGIGANTAVFSLVNGGLLRDRPYQDPESLVNIYTRVEGQSLYATSYEEDLEDLRALDDVFLRVGGYRGVAARIQEDDGARMVLAEAITSDLFPLVGVEMALGRGFTPEEELEAAANPVAILGHTLWRRRFGGAPDVLGQEIRLSGIPFTVVGVAPKHFDSFTAQSFTTDLFVPWSLARAVQGDWYREPAEGRGWEGTKIVARLRSGVSMEQAQARADGLMQGLKGTHPEAYEDRSFNLHPSRGVALQPDVDAFFMRIGLLLMAIVGLVLLLAATNLASALLARGMDRRREIAVRLALGARRGRLVRQLLTETAMVAALGALAGVLTGRWCLDLLVAIGPPTSLPLEINTRMDGTVLLFTAAAAVGAALVAGMAPALQSTRADVTPALKDGGRNGSPGKLTLRNGMVAFQVAISMILLMCGGLFVRSLQEAQETDPGFRTREAGLIWVDMQVGGVPREEWETTAALLTEGALSIPGVEVVGASNGLPLSEGLWQGRYTLPGVELPPSEDYHWAHYLAVDPFFLDAMGLPVVRGRGISPQDREGTEPVALVSEAAARRFWPDAEPLGREILPEAGERSYRVVGVVKDTKVANLREGPTPLFYFPREQYRGRTENLWLVATGTGAPSEITGALRRMVREVDPEMVVVEAKTMEEHLSTALFLPRLGALLMGFFGLMALALASLGLYGMVSFAASRRTREVGIRMSLGADRGSVIRMVVRDGMGVVVAGGILGWGLAALASRFLASFLVGIGPHDLVTLSTVPLLLFGVAALAALVPARRASRVSPVECLKTE